MAKMRSGMRMLAMAKATRGNQRMEGNQMDAGYNRMEGRQMNAGYNRMEGRQMNAGYNRMEGGQTDMMEAEMRRRRDSRGRYMEQEMTGRGEGRMEREQRKPDGENPYGDDPYRERQERSQKQMPERDEPEMRGADYSYRRADGGTGRLSYFEAHKKDPMEHRKPEEQQRMGFQQHDQKDKPFDKQTAMEWVECMEDKDGVKGGAYTWHQTQQYGRNMGITGEERLIEFYAAMNAMQSDYWPAAKKFGVDKPEFYAMMAKCFIEDADAVEDKVAKYYECIVEHK